MGEVAANVSQRREHGVFPSHLDRTATQGGTIVLEPVRPESSFSAQKILSPDYVLNGTTTLMCSSKLHKSSP
jgi:hypothetical protein